jgi:hypothetical protein
MLKYLKKHFHPSPCKLMELQLFEKMLQITIKMGHLKLNVFIASLNLSTFDKFVPFLSPNLFDTISFV